MILPIFFNLSLKLKTALAIANTLFQQHKRWLYTWTSPDVQYQNQIDYILCNQRWRSSIQSAKTIPRWLWLRLWIPYCKIQTTLWPLLKKKKKKTKNDSSLLLSGVDSLSCRQSVAWDHHISPTWELVRNATSQPPSRLKNQNSCGRSPAICFNKVTVDSGASLVAQLVKNPPAMWETWVQSLGWEDPLEKEKATHSSILAWRIPRTIQSMGSLSVGHNWATFAFTGWFWCSHVWECWFTSLSPYSDRGRCKKCWASLFPFYREET